MHVKMKIITSHKIFAIMLKILTDNNGSMSMLSELCETRKKPSAVIICNSCEGAPDGKMSFQSRFEFNLVSFAENWAKV